MTESSPLRLAWLHVPAYWTGGARRVSCRVDYGVYRHLTDEYHVWCVVTARNDPQYPYGACFFVPEELIELRQESGS